MLSLALLLVFCSLLDLGSAWNQPSTCLVRESGDSGGLERELREIKETLQDIADKLIEVPTDETPGTTQPSITEPPTTQLPETTAPPTAPSETCGGPGWRRVAYLNMTDPNQECPEGLPETSYSIRTCGKGSLGAQSCVSTIFPVGGIEYSQVCGRVRAYQVGEMNSFQGHNNPGLAQTINGYYGDGLLFTHGDIERTHIWSFVAGWYQGSAGRDQLATCPCESNAIYGPPPFVGDDYFCQSGTTAAGSTLFDDDPIWDNEGCIPSSSCCELNNPPWFSKTLPASTTDDIEMRLCLLRTFQGDIAVEQIDIYVY